MSKRAFWNLAGRAGRLDQAPVGVVGIAAAGRPDEIRQYVSDAAEDLASRLVQLLAEIDQAGQLQNLELIIHGDQWADFRAYVAHLWNEHRDLERVLAETEGALRNTFGFSMLRGSDQPAHQRRADALLEATRGYAAELAEHPENATLADATGFSPEGVRTAMSELRSLEAELDETSWEPSQIFGQAESILPDLVGVMLAIPQLRGALRDLSPEGLDRERISNISRDWVAGRRVEEIARSYFQEEGDDLTKAISTTCRAIYRSLGYAGTWGLSALAKMPGSGIDFEALDSDQREAINNLPAMLYYGVSSSGGVLMRMNSVPRSAAESLGAMFVNTVGEETATPRPSEARAFLKNLTDHDWARAAPEQAAMSGEDYRRVWSQLSGEPIED